MSQKYVQIMFPTWPKISSKTFAAEGSSIKGFQITRKGLLEKEHENYSEKIKGDLKRRGVYFLFGDSLDGVTPKVYVGETKKGVDRWLDGDHQEKEHWNYAILFYSISDDDLNKDMCLYLEDFIIKKVEEYGRYDLVSYNSENQKNASEKIKARGTDIFEEFKLLLNSIGNNIFTDLVDKSINDQDIFTCKSRTGGDGKLIFSNEGPVILKGSVCASKASPNWEDDWQKKINILIDNKTLRKEGSNYIFEKDTKFESPSAAGSLIRGNRVNGWKEWKNAKKETLDEVYRNTDKK